MKVSIKNAIAGIFGNSINSLLDYLKERHPFRMMLDGCFIIIVSWGVGSAYIVSTNFDTFKHKFGLEDPEEQQNALNRMANNAKAIQTIIDEVRTAVNAGRSFIIYFHNGKTTVDGRSFFFKSMTHQSLKPGVSSSIETAQNLPASLNIDQMQAILSGKCYSYNIAQGSNPAFDDLMKKHGTEITLDCPLLNIDGHIIGYIGVAYLEAGNKKLSDEQIFNKLKDAAEKLRYLL